MNGRDPLIDAMHSSTVGPWAVFSSERGVNSQRDIHPKSSVKYEVDADICKYTGWMRGTEKAYECI